MELFIIMFSLWGLSSVINLLYIAINDEPVEAAHVIVVFIPIINTLYTILVVCRLKRIKSVVKNVINIFKE